MDQPGTKEAALGLCKKLRQDISGSWASGPGGVLAQEEGRVMEARVSGGWAEGVTWRS